MSDKLEEILVSPVSSMVREVGISVAEASIALSKAQAEMIQNRPKELVEAGIMPSFYHMQDVDVELKMTVQIEETKQQSGKKKWALFATPMNAKYKNALKYETEGSSSLKIRFAPGPPPLALEQE
ncbi:hypothetical protein INR77_02970 [Erythrobacter sp. SCSIO 43205]|uniref:hypothetical protein n=1 Tax=Erythrobacter sp. SCSIO 43205 TaxID=2779361 RepID=UPI001CA80D4B|nr:hypothetical protein [Erythrobacter sp. SCSIO 43205]UAB78705.1 hypothetical protein INR77_02970 [Erythrobacter sp. SCSIO 43205]